MTTPVDPEYSATLHAQRRSLLEILRSTRFTSLAPHVTHQQIIPGASYSPWYDDTEFQQVYTQVRSNTLVDIYRCHELWSLVQRTRRIAGGVVEIGVWRGGTAAILCAANQKVRPGEVVQLFDTFEGVVNAVPGRDTRYRGGEHADASESGVRVLLEHLHLPNFQIGAGVFPDETGAALAQHIRLCHVDVDTYGSAKACIDYVWPRISIGGSMIFDDYGFWGCEGVTDLLNDEPPEDSILLHNLNGHGILLKVPSSAR